MGVATTVTSPVAIRRVRTGSGRVFGFDAVDPVGTQVIGRLRLEQIPTDYTPGHLWSLRTLWVEAPHRRCGVATALLDAMRTLVAGTHRVGVFVPSDDIATIGCLMAHGFTATAPAGDRCAPESIVHLSFSGDRRCGR